MNILRGVLRHVSDSIVAVVAGDGVKRFNATAGWMLVVRFLPGVAVSSTSFARPLGETHDRQLMRGGGGEWCRQLCTVYFAFFFWSVFEGVVNGGKAIGEYAG
ncbi:hypothetical protein EJ110_NYTH25976 [Nymphaea thermarum]|nr:hypothetical protein EJ110_NYTH25976 [Nymphaea thermarum]